MRWLRRTVVGVLALSAALYALVALGLWALQDGMIFPAPDGPAPAASGVLALETVETPDGERLAALWHPPEPGETTLLFLHGNGGAIAHLAATGERWAAEGFGFLVPAWRGYPGSTGAPSEGGILIDATAAYDFAAARTDGPIAVYGQSLGTGAAVHLATERDVAALVLEAPYDSVLAVASARFPFAPVGSLLRHPFRSDERIAKVSAPVLIGHGEADGIIPIAHGAALHGLAGEGARLLRFPEANHFDIHDRLLEPAIAFVREAADVSLADATR